MVMTWVISAVLNVLLSASAFFASSTANGPASVGIAWEKVTIGTFIELPDDAEALIDPRFLVKHPDHAFKSIVLDPALHFFTGIGLAVGDAGVHCGNIVNPD